MFKHSLFAAALALVGFNAIASNDYYVVVPVHGRTAAADQIMVSLAGATPPGGTVGIPYSGFDLKPLLTVAGDSKYTGYGVKWSLVSGNLPPGLTLSPDGTIGGTPTAAGGGIFQVKAAYKTKAGVQAYQIVVANITIALAGGVPQEAIVGQAYSYDLKSLLTVDGDLAYNGSGVTWAVVSDSLPAGLQLRTDGTISGTPTTAGTGSVMARATYRGISGQQTYQVVALDINVSLAKATLPAAKIGSAYATYDFKNLLTVNGDSNYKVEDVTFAGVSVPQGLSLSQDGLLTGTPTTKNSAGSAFQVLASYKSKTGQQVYTLVVNGLYLDAVKIMTGASHTCALTPNGGVKCWGQNSYGQLGNNSTSNSLVPVDVTGLSAGVLNISLGASHSCALTTTGGVKCWGQNSYGQLGNNSTSNSLVPVDVSGLTAGVGSIDAGNYFTCAVTLGGGAKCWGMNLFGQLGNNSTTQSNVPVDVTGLSAGVASISGGGNQTCAVTTTGGAKCWGINSYGQLGNNSTAQSNIPVDVSGLSAGVASISAGGNHTCAVIATGGATCWGLNSLGQLGINSTTNSAVPLAVSGFSAGVASIAAGPNHTCMVTKSGSAKCWGQNTFGQLGNNSTTQSNVPVDVSGLSSGVTGISAGGNQTCAVTSNTGGAVCWGQNANGALGNNSTTASSVPVEVVNP